MPYGAVPFIPAPYVKPAYRDESVGRLSDLTRAYRVNLNVLALVAMPISVK